MGDSEEIAQSASLGWTEEKERRSVKAMEYSKLVPERIRRLYVDSVKRKASPRSAIKAMCQMCMGYEEYQHRIRDCSTYKCPLWAYRPYQPK